MTTRWPSLNGTNKWVLPKVATAVWIGMCKGTLYIGCKLKFKRNLIKHYLKWWIFLKFNIWTESITLVRLFTNRLCLKNNIAVRPSFFFPEFWMTAWKFTESLFILRNVEYNLHIICWAPLSMGKFFSFFLKCYKGFKSIKAVRLKAFFDILLM